MISEVKKIVSLNLLDYYDELNKTWTLEKLREVSGLTEEDVQKLIEKAVEESNQLEII